MSKARQRYRRVLRAASAISVALATCLALVLTGPTAALAGAAWHFEALDGVASVKPGHTTDGVGRNNATVVYNGHLHVFSRDTSAGSLRHDWWDGTAWRFETLDGTGSTEPGHTTDDVGTDTTVTIYGGQIHLFTLDGTTKSLRHDWWDGTAWRFETLDGKGSGLAGHTIDQVGEYNSVVVYGTTLHVFSHDFTFTSDSLRHEWWNGSAWGFETLDGNGSTWAGHTPDGVGQGTFATIYGGTPHVFTLDETAVNLRHEWWDGTAWRFETLDGAGSTWPGHTTDQVGTANAVVVYGTTLQAFTWDITLRSLRHEWWDGAAWHSETLDGTGSTWPGHTTDGVGTGNAVTVFNGQIQVFTSDDAFTLRHDWWDGTTWHLGTLDGPGSALPGHTSDFVGTDNAVIVYGAGLHVFTDQFNVAAQYSLRHDWYS